MPRARTPLAIGLAVAISAALAGCGNHRPAYDPGAMPVDSTAFPRGGAIPKRYAADGADVSPPLSWSRPPAAAKELVLVVQDADAATVPLGHWLLYGIPPTVTSIPEGIPRGPQPVAEAGGALQGTNDLHELGWSGPNPPPGDSFHRYEFWIFALDAPSRLPAGADRAAVIATVKKHKIAEGRLLGTYQR